MSTYCRVPYHSGPVVGSVCVPGSKSITNRVLPMAALAQGQTTIRGALFSDDSRYCMESLQRLGYHVRADEAQATLYVDGAGTAPLQHAGSTALFVGNSGTTARFMTALVALGNGEFTIDGVQRMRERPIGDLLGALNVLGADAQSLSATGCPPVVVRASGLRGGRVQISGQDSSQFVTALLLAAPYMQEGIILDVVGELVSRPYVEMTARMMEQFGVSVIDEGNRFTVGKGMYLGQDYLVEPDASGASYFLALAAASGGSITIENMRLDSLQGDAQFATVLVQMGCTLDETDRGLTLTGPEDGLQGIDVDLFAMSDTMPTLAAIAPLAKGPVRIRNVANVRLKETDRISACVTELRRFGVTVDEQPDGLTIYPCHTLHTGIRVETYDDHRMAMAFAILGLHVKDTEIADPMCVQKTFPDYFVRLEKVLGNEFTFQ